MQCLSVSLYVKKIIRDCSLTQYLEIQTQHFFHNQNKELLWTINKVSLVWKKEIRQCSTIKTVNKINHG